MTWGADEIVSKLGEMLRGLDWTGLATKLLWAICGGLFVAWRTRRKEAAKAARQACNNLRLLLGEWFDGIEHAVKFEKSTDRTRQKLREFQKSHKFEPRLANELIELAKEQDYQDLRRLTNVFHATALDSKGRLAMVLADARYMRDYESHKAEAIMELKNAHKDFEAELKRVESLIDKKMKRLF